MSRLVDNYYFFRERINLFNATLIGVTGRWSSVSRTLLSTPKKLSRTPAFVAVNIGFIISGISTSFK
ncbi:hypothetical protein V7122_18265 [Bacillus sp. JJ1532]|uniref:hypothetical protein n=1 Tax=unclassified Bacillus (in: firmicutes) TaxID=185979 RepID=UPI002FFE4A19